jgi:hypothetical protein
MRIVYLFGKGHTGLFLLSILAMGLLMPGCASKPPPPPNQPTPGPAPYAQAALTPDQIARLSQESPATAHRVQALQPLTPGDIKLMTKIGFDPNVIINQVRNSRTVFHLTASQIIDLKNAGVGDQVIDFLISTPSSIAGSTPVPEPQTNMPMAQTPPPPPPDETQPPSPGADYVWVDGDWVWNGGWVWVGGHWVIPPYPHAVWFHGGWVRGWRGFHRGPGRWR